MRYFFEIAYNGRNYAGWQSQANATSVQAVIEHALLHLMREPVKIYGSGRTDTGVHSEQQFFHCDLDKTFDTHTLIFRLNSFLPRDIAVRNVRRVKPDASARFDAVERSYQYRITREKDPFLEGLAWHSFKPVDLPTMNKAAALLIGEHDFQCFSKVHTDVNHFLCHVKRAQWREQGAMLLFDITANRFLRGMVRSIVGTLMDVGTGKLSIRDFQSIIESRDRKKAGANVPAHGLYLTRIRYPASVFAAQAPSEE